MRRLGLRAVGPTRAAARACDQSEHGHANRHSIARLLEHQRARAKAYLAGDLDTFVDRPGMQVKGTRLGPRERTRVDLVALDVVGERDARLHALLLDTETHDCIGPRNGRL